MLETLKNILGITPEVKHNRPFAGRREQCAKPAQELEAHFHLHNIAGNYQFPKGEAVESLEIKLVNAMFERSEANENANDANHPYQQRWQKHADKLERKGLKELSNVVNTFIQLNPELESINVDKNDIKSMYDFALGVMSGFNAEDIACYLGTNNKNNSYNYERRDALSEKLQKLAEKEGLAPIENGIEWMPAPSTLHRIESQVDSRLGLAPKLQEGQDPFSNPDAARPGELAEKVLISQQERGALAKA